MANKRSKEESPQRTETAPPTVPSGVKLVRTLRGHTGWIGRIAWSPDGWGAFTSAYKNASRATQSPNRKVGGS